MGTCFIFRAISYLVVNVLTQSCRTRRGDFSVFSRVVEILSGDFSVIKGIFYFDYNSYLVDIILIISHTY